MTAFSSRSLLSFSVLGTILATAALQAQPAPASRVLQAVDNNVRITLPGNTHPLARPEFDQGEAPADLPMKRMLLVLKRSPEQESALLSLLDGQQDKHSPNYHKWLTPKEFGTRFGPPIPTSPPQATGSSPAASKSPSPARAARNRILRHRLPGASSLPHADHKFVVRGKEHWANAKDPQIPAALEPVVAGVHSLHNFFKQPQIAQMKQAPAIFSKTPVPHVTFTDGRHALGPQDFAKIYNFGPAGIDGSNTRSPWSRVPNTTP